MRKLRDKILALLKKYANQYVSGEELSRLLGVSRTAIWKHVNTLREEGYHIDSVPKLGYRLEGVPDKMLPYEITNGLNTRFLGRQIFYHEEVDSTNNEAKVKAEKNLPEGTMVIAEAQRAGKGRLGRSWASPKGKGLWFSLILRPPVSPREVGKFTLLAAVAIAKVLRESYGLPVGIKWPNDILCRGRKICGILLEMKAEADVVDYLVLGIGLNVSLESGDFPPEVKHRATSLEIELGRPVNRLKLLQELLEELEKQYLLALEEGFEPIIKLWLNHNLTIGQEVRIQSAWQEPIQGKAIAIDPAGGLVVELPDKRVRTFYSGDVTLQAEEPKSSKIKS